MSDLLADALQEGDKTYAMFLEKINWNRISTISFRFFVVQSVISW